MRALIRSALSLALMVLPRAALSQGVTAHPVVDSGVLIRIHTATATSVGRLLAPASRADSVIRYCRYPGPPCDTRDSLGVYSVPVADVLQLEVQHGTGAGHHALVGGV